MSAHCKVKLADRGKQIRERELEKMSRGVKCPGTAGMGLIHA